MNNKFEICDECGSAFDTEYGYTVTENDFVDSWYAFMEIDAELVKEKIGIKLCSLVCIITAFPQFRFLHTPIARQSNE